MRRSFEASVDAELFEEQGHQANHQDLGIREEPDKTVFR